MYYDCTGLSVEWIIAVVVVTVQSNMQIRSREKIKRKIKGQSENGGVDLFVQRRITIGWALLRGKSQKRIGGRAENWNRARRGVSRKVIHSYTRDTIEDRKVLEKQFNIKTKTCDCVSLKLKYISPRKILCLRQFLWQVRKERFC